MSENRQRSTSYLKVDRVLRSRYSFVTQINKYLHIEDH